MSETPILEMRNITKVYPNGIIANQDVNFSIARGEIHGLIGENGAGKSTLMNILFGGQKPDSGQIILEGKEVSIGSSIQAISYGIGMVHQHYALVPNMTVAENVFLGIEPKKNGFVDRKKELEETERLAKLYNFHLNAADMIKDLSVGTKQKVEILKALVRGAKILILDEPTAVLTPQETEELFKELLLFKKNGHTIVFISHKLNEVKQICDRITIMKHGRSVGSYELEGMDESDISKLMIGRDAVNTIKKEKAVFGESILQIKDLYCYEDGMPRLSSVNIQVHRGEILGIAGVEGNGQQELAECIAGLRPSEKGKVTFLNKDITNRNARDVRAMKIAYISDDRIGQGTAGDASIESNIIADKLENGKMMKGIFIDRKKCEQFVEQQITDFVIAADSPKQPVRMLSGGNMQKVVVAREMSDKPELLIANQPTRGVDVGAMEFIHNKIVELRDQGSGVIMVSADLNEILECSDSLIVMYDGRVAAYFEDASKVSEEELGYYMLGVKTMDAKDIAERMWRA